MRRKCKATDWKKIFAMSIYDKGFISTMCKEH